MTTAPPAVTASGRIKLPKLDKDAIVARATAEVVQTLDSIEDDERRLQQATNIIDRANGFLADNEPRMKKMALYLALIKGAVAVSDATSMSRYAFYKLTVDTLGPDWKRPASWDDTVAARAKARGVRIHRDAVTELPPLAEKVAEAHAQKEAATKYRDQIVLRLVERGMNHGEVAQLIGRERSRVTQIVSASHKAG